MHRLALLVLMAASLTGAAATVESLAVFADSEVNAANAFSSGTVSITDNPDSAFLTFANMAPGDAVVASLEMQNTGSLQFRYAMTTSATDPDAKGLRDQLVLTVREWTVNNCPAQDGAILYQGALSAGAFGSVAQGAQAGDRVLGATTSEVLCFHAALPIGTGNAFQDATTTATFTFEAEQTANNP